MSHNSIRTFIKLPLQIQVQLLKSSAILLDTDFDNTVKTNLYFYDGFFAEETVSLSSDQVIDVLPFNQGYRLESCVNVRRHFLKNGSLTSIAEFLN
jgi:hypothetical protein